VDTSELHALRPPIHITASECLVAVEINKPQAGVGSKVKPAVVQ